MLVSLAVSSALLMSQVSLPPRPACAQAFDTFPGWTRTLGPSGPGAVELLSPPIDPGQDWDELVVSWNASLTEAQSLQIEARVFTGKGASRFFSFGQWSSDRQNFSSPEGRRTSIRQQKDTFGEMQTDTLVLSAPARTLEIKITISSRPGGPSIVPGVPDFLACSFRNSKAPVLQRETSKHAWGIELDVPMRSQLSYPNGKVICSPTSTSMLLAYWAKQLDQPAVDQDVPEVVAGVYDPAWKGTGNWPFNAAFAGRLGLRGYVLRLNDLGDAEELLAAGIPLACSVSYALLKGKEKRAANDGHIVVLRGFTAEGDPIFNDPGRATEVRQVYPREAFKRAWAVSGQTAYIVHPPSKPRPKLSVD